PGPATMTRGASTQVTAARCSSLRRASQSGPLSASTVRGGVASVAAASGGSSTASACATACTGGAPFALLRAASPAVSAASIVVSTAASPNSPNWGSGAVPGPKTRTTPYSPS